jgi:hypothetical protein
VNGIDDKVGLVMVALGALPITIGLLWIYDEHYAATSGSSRPKPSASSVALQCVPLYRGGALTLSGRF